MLTEDSEYWQVLDDVHRQNGIDVLDTLTDSWGSWPFLFAWYLLGRDCRV